MGLADVITPTHPAHPLAAPAGEFPTPSAAGAAAAGKAAAKPAAARGKRDARATKEAAEAEAMLAGIRASNKAAGVGGGDDLMEMLAANARRRAAEAGGGGLLARLEDQARAGKKAKR